ncbi:MAG TPA: ABC transporter substrate-binding protein [Acidimicrobiia bacterium]|nr:ABC transporter substrate-binding protein [Acidimicrobiia bacterium]
MPQGTGTAPASPNGTPAGASLARAGAGAQASGTTPGNTSEAPKAPAGGTASGQGSDRAAGGAAPTPGPGGGASAPAPAAPGGPKSPVVLASVGTYSGPAGGVLAPIMAGSQVWVKWINQRGGLNGHKVNYLVYDDAGDPARHSAQVKEAVEQRGAIAFLTNAEAVTGQSGAAYITSKRVPVVGMSGGENWAVDSPMYFPQKSFGPGLYQLFPRAFAPVVVPKGMTKWGIVYCVEAQGCKDVARTFADESDKLGYKLVYQAQASIAQPDFTAECLSARNAGVQALEVLLDQTSVERFATACNRQGYRPQYLIPSQALADRLKDNPLLDGALSVTDVFPWFVSGTPAVDEFHAAMKAFGANVPPGLQPAEGWVSGKLLEVAAANLEEPPTTAQILAGLWKVRNNTLGGITAPLTFTENQPTKPYACGALVVTRNGAWVASDPTVKCYP